MGLEKLLQIKISRELYNELVLEAMKSGLTVAQVSRLRLSGKKIVDKSELKNDENRPRFRPVNDLRR